MRSKAAKKYIFLGLLTLSVSGFFISKGLGTVVLAVLFAWLASENARRTRFRFLPPGQGREINFGLAAIPAQMEISSGGKSAVFVTLDQALSLWTFAGPGWKRPLEPRTLALLPLDDGGCYYATEDSLVLLDPRGQIAGRAPFEPPRHRQSYRLLLSTDRGTLCLHTPWFLQFISADLTTLKGRISCEQTGHFMKYANLSPDGSRVFFAGAKMLEESETTQARWGCWSLRGGDWTEAWNQAEESGGNSHVRGLAASRDGSTLALELHREGYEFRILSEEGTLKWRRTGGEKPCLGFDGRFVLWENPYEGLTLSEVDGQRKIWTRKVTQSVRAKSLMDDNTAVLLEGRRLVMLDSQGEARVNSWLDPDPTRLCLAESGKALALVESGKAALVELVS